MDFRWSAIGAKDRRAWNRIRVQVNAETGVGSEPNSRHHTPKVITIAVKIIISESFQVASGGVNEIETSAGTVGACLKEAVKKAPALQKLWFTGEGELSKYVILCLNGESISRSYLDRPVKDGDEIMPILVIGGG